MAPVSKIGGKNHLRRLAQMSEVQEQKLCIMYMQSRTKHRREWQEKQRVKSRRQLPWTDLQPTSGHASLE